MQELKEKMYDVFSAVGKYEEKICKAHGTDLRKKLMLLNKSCTATRKYILEQSKVNSREKKSDHQEKVVEEEEEDDELVPEEPELVPEETELVPEETELVPVKKPRKYKQKF